MFLTFHQNSRVIKFQKFSRAASNFNYRNRKIFMSENLRNLLYMCVFALVFYVAGAVFIESFVDNSTRTRTPADTGDIIDSQSNSLSINDIGCHQVSGSGRNVSFIRMAAFVFGIMHDLERFHFTMDIFFDLSADCTGFSRFNHSFEKEK